MYTLRQILPPHLALLICFQWKHWDELGLQNYLVPVIALHNCHSVTTPQLTSSQNKEVKLRNTDEKCSYPSVKIRLPLSLIPDLCAVLLLVRQ